MQYILTRFTHDMGFRVFEFEGIGDDRVRTLDVAITVDALLDELAKKSQQQRAVVELKFFLGLTDDEAAGALNLTLHTLQREWSRARRWLFERLKEQEP
jgi:DNA-directed RNA polymerase specialized sigma24 family protein